MTIRFERDLAGPPSKPRNGPGHNAVAEGRCRRAGSPAPTYVERDLTGWERLLLAVGVHLACAVIAVVDHQACQGRIGRR